MGWDSSSSWKSKKEVQNELRRDISKNAEIIAEKSTSEGIWYVLNTPDSGRFIYFALVKKERGEFFVKTMTEDMGPSYFSCPTTFFSLTDEPKAQYAVDWRKSVLALSERKSRKIEKGMNISVYGKTYVVDSAENKILVRSLETGSVFRLSKKNISDLEII